MRDVLIHSNNVVLSGAYLLSSADLGHQSRPAQERNTSSHTSSSPNLKPEHVLALCSVTTYFIGFLRRFSSAENKRMISMLSQFVTVAQRTSQEKQREHEEIVQDQFGMLPEGMYLRANKAFISCISPSPPPPLPPLDLFESLLPPDPGGLLSS